MLFIMILICMSLILNEEVHLLVLFVWAVRVTLSVNCSFGSFASFSTALFLLLIYRSSVHNLAATSMLVTHQGMVVSFDFPKREKNSFHELQTMV